MTWPRIDDLAPVGVARCGPGGCGPVGVSSCPVGLDAGGIPACSRWLSAATPPVPGFRRLASRQGCQPRQDADRTPLRFLDGGCLDGAGTPPGSRKILGRRIPVVSLSSTIGYWLGSLRDWAGLPRRGCGPAGCTTQHKGPDQGSAGSARSALRPRSTQQTTENSEEPFTDHDLTPSSHPPRGNQ